ncbi:MAG: acyl carrier protein [Oribacterium sp.]|jgi:acyl carrier protein|uniref:acyl carrier protein n=1 Tax=unclassified Oribacterium TaxID=2629782 RepID=UPI0004E1B26C|nr:MULTISPECIES: acyl carrier protein [unclassified Oribacterium]MBO5597454.1 acyl carrier protein [Oribacterium sp.]MBO6308334.1 acyl carrier protein [Oribacterium sp.]MBP3805597.1 acyl carrier protein [Oribacterium sp.]SDZ89583.1 acyl carrier protein [Oribacterium sp. KHPX15]
MEFEKLKEIIIREVSHVKADKITLEAKFVDDLEMDSLDVVQVVMAIEEEFGIEVPDDAAEHLTTVQEAVTAIHDAVAAKG